MNVRQSRYINWLSATTIGTNITVGAGVFLIIGLVFDEAGRQTPLSYLLSFIFFLPLVLTTAERALANPAGGGLIHITNLHGRVPLTFAVGWFMIGGLILFSALLGWGVSAHVDLLLTDRLGLDLSIPAGWLAALIILGIALNRYFGLQANWTRRRIVLVTGLLLVLFILWQAFRSPPESISGYAYLPPGDRLEGLPLLAAALWGLVFIVERLPRLRRPNTTLLPAMLTALGLMAGAGALITVLLLQFPLVAANSITPLASLAAAVGPVSDLFLLLVIILILFIGMDQVWVTILRLIGDMVAGGYLPHQIQTEVTGRGTTIFAATIVAALSIPSVLFFSPNQLLAGASLAFLAMITLVHIPGLFQIQSPLPADRPLRLPFHPLLPIGTIIISLSLAISLPLDDLWPILGWTAAGILLFTTYSRRAAIAARRRQDVIAETVGRQPEKTKPRLLVAIADPQTEGDLLRAAAQIARARDYALLVLMVVVTPESAPGIRPEAVSPDSWELLNQSLAGLDVPDLEITPMVRLAPSALDGIQATIWEEKVDSLLLGWPAGEEPKLVQQEGLVEQLVRLAACEVQVMHGRMPETLNQVLVPLTNDSHSPAALALGRDLILPAAGHLRALKPVTGKVTTEIEANIRSQVDAVIQEGEPVEQRVISVDDVKAAILAESANYDLTILGVLGEGFLNQTYFGGLPVAVAEAEPDRPVLLVKRKESQPAYLARQGWEQLSGVLPTLSLARQKEVRSGMVRDARAGIDFYIMIILSASIAFLGLLQNSTAVIIGAMLVAPLMSPILAMAFGIVRGNVPATRQAANSTVNGIVLAIALPTMLSFFLAAIDFGSLEPTSQILARTQPGILDLMVALLSGAAAAYAVSRAEVAAALPGVAIAAALVPPLAVVGYGLGTARFDDAIGAMLLFLTNLSAIVLAGATMFLLLGFRPPLRDDRNLRTQKGLQLALISLAVISIPLVLTAISSRRSTQQQAIVENVLLATWRPNEVEVTEMQIFDDPPYTVVALSLLDYSGEATAYDIQALQENLSATLGKPVRVDAQVVNGRLDQIDNSTILPTQTPTMTPTMAVSATLAATEIPPLLLTVTAGPPTIPAGESATFTPLPPSPEPATATATAAAAATATIANTATPPPPTGTPTLAATETSTFTPEPAGTATLTPTGPPTLTPTPILSATTTPLETQTP